MTAVLWVAQAGIGHGQIMGLIAGGERVTVNLLNRSLGRGGQSVSRNSMLLRWQQPSVSFVVAAVANEVLGCCQRNTGLLGSQQHAETNASQSSCQSPEEA